MQAHHTGMETYSILFCCGHGFFEETDCNSSFSSSTFTQWPEGVEEITFHLEEEDV